MILGIERPFFVFFSFVDNLPPLVVAVVICWANATVLGTRRVATSKAYTDVGAMRFLTLDPPLPRICQTPDFLSTVLLILNYLVYWSTDANFAPRALVHSLHALVCTP